MGGFFSAIFGGGSSPAPPPPPASVPVIEDPSIQKAGLEEQRRAQERLGRRRTILTSPQGLTEAQQIPSFKKTLLG